MIYFCSEVKQTVHDGKPRVKKKSSFQCSTYTCKDMPTNVSFKKMASLNSVTIPCSHVGKYLQTYI